MKFCTKCLFPDTKPDIFFDDEADDFKIDSKTDSQLNYALKLLTT